MAPYPLSQHRTLKSLKNFKSQPGFPSPYTVHLPWQEDRTRFTIRLVVSIITLKNSDTRYESPFVLSSQVLKRLVSTQHPLGGMRAQTRAMACCLLCPLRPSVHGSIDRNAFALHFPEV